MKTKSYSLDTLRGGSRERLAKYRRNLARSLETIRGCRTSEAANAFIKNAGYTSPLNHRHGWLGDAHGINVDADDIKRGYVSAPWGLVDGWRDVGDASDIITLRHTGWYSDADASELYLGHVWQLPARNGSPVYVAGYVEDQGGKFGTRAGGYVVLSCDSRGLETFDDKEDAARAGDGLAERMAEDAREYSERWHEASRASDKRDEARTDSHAARQRFAALAKAWRVCKAAGKDGEANALASLMENERNKAREAVERMREKTERIAELDMTGEF